MFCSDPEQIKSPHPYIPPTAKPALLLERRNRQVRVLGHELIRWHWVWPGLWVQGLPTTSPGHGPGCDAVSSLAVSLETLMNLTQHVPKAVHVHSIHSAVCDPTEGDEASACPSWVQALNAEPLRFSSQLQGCLISEACCRAGLWTAF